MQSVAVVSIVGPIIRSVADIKMILPYSLDVPCFLQSYP